MTSPSEHNTLDPRIISLDNGGKEEHYFRVPMDEYVRLIKAEVKLDLLDAGGVDNWDWYEGSLEDYEEEAAQALITAGIPEAFRK